jgi:hypothetical protein
MASKKIIVHDSLQDYEYTLSHGSGKGFDPLFRPDLTPKEMLELGVFGGHYFEGQYDEFPPSWFEHAVLSDTHNPDLNFFHVDASQSREVWLQKGWIYEEDPRGWFQWYCRYYLGRRIQGEDERQIKRWKAMRRHASQITKACEPGDAHCRPRQRQALLHWAYDSRIL